MTQVHKSEENPKQRKNNNLFIITIEILIFKSFRLMIRCMISKLEDIKNKSIN